MKIQTSKFSLGQTFMTPGSMKELHPEDVIRALTRHSFGDWGDSCAEDRAANDLALKDGSRIFSVYHDRFGKTFWVITEADRVSTTILLPSEYLAGSEARRID